MKYTCPRCNIVYCSVACYQSPVHLQCSEEFYKNCVAEEMAMRKQMRSGTLDNIPGMSDDMKQMYEILKRMDSTQPDFDISEEELDSDDDDNNEGNENPNQSVELSERMNGVDLNDADAVWGKLTESERKEFGQIIKDEDVTAILPTFNPWWENKIQKVMITEVNDDQSTAASGTEHQYSQLHHPNVIETQLDFTNMTKKPPSKCVAHNIINVLAAYTSTVRFFYGEHSTNSYEAVNYLLAVCANLRVNANFNDTSLAIESIRHEAHTEGFTFDESDIQQIQKDIDSITEGPDPVKQTNLYVLAALSDIHSLLTIAKSMRKPKRKETLESTSCKIIPSKEQAKEFEKFIQRFGDHKIVEFQEMDRIKVNTSIKKIEYYLAYVQKFQ